MTFSQHLWPLYWVRLTSVGRYQIVEELGRGAMGTVYKAFDPAINRAVAIKAIRLDAFADLNEQSRVRERIKLEAQAAGVLSHPHIVTVFDIWQEDNNSFIITEFIGGPSLERLLRERHVPASPVLIRYLQQAAEALDFAHGKGVLHRDIKPANLILTEGAAASIKVADFGVAKYISQDATHSGTMMGTPAYMSPEQIQGFPADGRADQFSLAVVIYELLTGEKPFVGDGLAALFYQVCKVTPRIPSHINSAIPRAADLAIMRALSKEPAGRFRTCGDLTIGLREAYSNRTGNALASTAATAPLAAAVGGEAIAIVEPQVAASPRVPLSQSQDPEGGDSYLPRRRERESSRDTSLWVFWIVGGLLALLLVIFFSFRVARKQQRREAAVTAARPNVPIPNASNTPSPQVARPSAPPMPSASPGQESTPETNASNAANEKPSMTAPAETEFVSQPAGARISLDSGSDRGCVAPCLLQLPPGRHTLVASLDGYRDERRIFSTPLDTHLDIALTRQEGILVVGSEPAGATVIIDGKQIGKTPLTLHLSVGTHQLTLVNGASRREDTVEVRSDSFESRSVRW